jgi:hypothetical protein
VDLVGFIILLWLLYRDRQPGDGPPSWSIADAVEDLLDHLVTVGRSCAAALLLMFLVAGAVSVAVWVVRVIGGWGRW